MVNLLNNWSGGDSWSFENTGRLEDQHGESGAEREIVIRYNQQVTGNVRVSCIDHSHRSAITLANQISVKIMISNARYFGAMEIYNLAFSAAGILATTAGEINAIKFDIFKSMVNCIWQVGDQAIGNPEFEFSFQGTADWYLREWLPQNR